MTSLHVQNSRLSGFATFIDILPKNICLVLIILSITLKSHVLKPYQF